MADPPSLGIGVILQSWPDEEVLAAGRRFAESLDLDGPIAIEFKRDADGTLWLIEPNAGRSEFCVDLVIQSGVNLVYLEFLHAIGKLAVAPVVRPRREVVWFDTQKDPTSFVMLCLKGRTLRPFGKRPVFPYFGHNDLKPLAAASIAVAKDLATRIARRIRSRVERGRVGASASG
jgi:predicted ATP-grasp superfamily ATP-dependent carboligase